MSNVKIFLTTNFSFLILTKATKLCIYSPRSSRQKRKGRAEIQVPLLSSLLLGNRRTNTVWFLQRARIQKFVVCLEIPSNKNLYHIESGLYMIRLFINRLVILASKSYLWQCLKSVFKSRAALRNTKSLITMVKSDWAKKRTW